MKKIEEIFIIITEYISNFLNATDISSKIYWLRVIHTKSKELASLIEDELKLDK